MGLKPAQLASIKRLLRNAHSLVEDAAVMFRKSGDEETARRLKSVADFIADEILEADQKIVLSGRAQESKL
jgi:hypothetical protein